MVGHVVVEVNIAEDIVVVVLVEDIAADMVGGIAGAEQVVDTVQVVSQSQLPAILALVQWVPVSHQMKVPLLRLQLVHQLEW